MADNTQDNMMRIAIAGSGGLARTFAQHINETVHLFIILSRQAQPELEALYPNQVFAVDYESQDDLRFALRGIDLVISTVSGSPQINLIDAAAHSEVRRFVPAEFEGQPRRRPRNDPIDRGRAACLERLRHWSASNRHQMDYTVFTCGVFYERFTRGGLGSLGIGASSNVYYPGSYLMNVEAGTAEIVETSTGGHPVRLVLTSITDVARFLVSALEIDLNTWPEEFRMQGDRRTVTEIVQWAGMIKGFELSTEIIQAKDLRAHLEHATYHQDFEKVARIHELMATEQRRYDFGQANLNALVDIEPTPFWNWLSAQWSV